MSISDMKNDFCTNMTANVPFDDIKAVIVRHGSKYGIKETDFGFYTVAYQGSTAEEQFVYVHTMESDKGPYIKKSLLKKVLKEARDDFRLLICFYEHSTGVSRLNMLNFLMKHKQIETKYTKAVDET